MFFKLAINSLRSRKSSVLLTLMAMVVSIFVLLGVEHIRQQAKHSFSNTVSGIDLIVGARTGSLNLLLYSVFRIGSPTNNVSWQAFNDIAANANVAWAIPISLGDSHQGYRVMGTTQDYFKYFKYGKQHPLAFAAGAAFTGVFDVVLGSAVAKKLNYKLGDKIVIAHGIGNTSFSLHDDRPFTVVGILEPTGTPVDQTLHVSLAGIEAVHIDWHNGVKLGSTITTEQLQQRKLTPKTITAFMLGLKSRISTFHVQRQINNYTNAPLMAVLPGVALAELWQMMGLLENILRLISVLVVFAAILSVTAMLLASLRERHREIQLLRVIGAPPGFLFLLIELEALAISLLSIEIAGVILYGCLIAIEDFLAAEFGLYLSPNIFSSNSVYLTLAVLAATLIAAIIPSLTIYNKAKTGSSESP